MSQEEIPEMPPSGEAGSKEKDPSTITVKELRRRREETQKKTRKLSLAWYASLGTVFILLTLAIVVLPLLGETVEGDLSEFYALIVYGIIAVVGAFYFRERLEESQTNLRDLDFEIELASYSISERQVRAERLFRRNEYELLKYYNLNLRQNRWVMFVGIGCIVVSVAIVIGTLSAVMGGFDQFLDKTASKNDTTEVWLKGISGVVGAVSAIMVNVVAAIYLQIHGRAAEALGQFHERLVKTHELFMSNVLASRIESEDKRENLLVDLAKSIIQGN